MVVAQAARRVWVAVTIVVSVSCGSNISGPSGPSPAPTTISEAARSYLESILEVAERVAVHKAAIDWPGLRAEVFAEAGAAQAIADTFPAIGVALRRLNDHESLYISSTGVRVGGAGGSCAAASVASTLLPSTVGYLNVPGCNCQDAAANSFAESLQRIIRDQDRPDLDGWVVDLRANEGGNMWPMLAGVGPLIGEGIVGYIVYNDREYEREYRNGAAMSFGETLAIVSSPYTTFRRDPRVAVWTSGRTISAGEAIAAYFKGRPETRSFGEPTCGHHHLLEEFRLRDSARLVLVTAVHHDRTRRMWQASIAPDELVSGQSQLVSRTVEWIQTGK